MCYSKQLLTEHQIQERIKEAKAQSCFPIQKFELKMGFCIHKIVFSKITTQTK